ncbi:hypothetical protein GW758_00755 [Candidatus Falkowbacteria bacterium]|nr:hypothetical protein [Candidatus Falkowbacteria bacterium]NCT54473.1 hypothetical protein [Candidatus Falkowbacteria bacterium]
MKTLVKKIKYLILAGIISPILVLAYDFEENSGLNITAGKAGYVDEQKSIDGMIVQGIKLVLTFVGVLFLILTIVAGFKWMTARGNEAEVEKAKKMFIQSVIGVLIILVAYALSYFIVQFFSEPYLT